MNNDKKIILVVDDASENLDVLSGILKQQYKVKAAKSGERALKIVEKAIPDLILLDVMMPDMDGYEVCQTIKSNPDTANVPVVFVTGMTDEKDQQKGMSLGAAGYLHKPVDANKVLEMVVRNIT